MERDRRDLPASARRTTALASFSGPASRSLQSTSQEIPRNLGNRINLLKVNDVCKVTDSKRVSDFSQRPRNPSGSSVGDSAQMRIILGTQKRLSTLADVRIPSQPASVTVFPSRTSQESELPRASTHRFQRAEKIDSNSRESATIEEFNPPASPLYAQLPNSPSPLSQFSDESDTPFMQPIGSACSVATDACTRPKTILAEKSTSKTVRGKKIAEWSDSNTKYVITRYFELLPNMKKHFWRVRRIYESISEELNELVENKANGINYSTDQVCNKVEYLLQRYKEVLQFEGKTGRNGRVWEYYEQIHEHMHARPIISKRCLDSFDQEPEQGSMDCDKYETELASTKRSKKSSTRLGVAERLMLQDEDRLEFLQTAQKEIITVCQSMVSAVNRLVDKL